MSNTISILGSTGSIGRQTLDVAEQMGLSVAAITAHGSVARMEEQARQFRPRLAVLTDETAAKDLAVRLADTETRVLGGFDALAEAAVIPQADTVVTAVVGMVGLKPTLAAIEAGKDIALANKETLVTAGHLVMKAAREKGVQILPVDSEHSAIFQSLQGRADSKISKILLTASGGPFRGKTRADLENVTVEQALAHPNWSMGAKITIDSASMVNKGLEMIEAHWLFDVSMDQIQVIIQPQSIIHSAVEYEDGAVIAQLGAPDMKLPIQYALTYPNRFPLPGERLDFTKISSIQIETPDKEPFLGLPLAEKASSIGGSMPTVLNEANEHAVAAFLAGKIRFLEIYDMIQYAMDQHKLIAHPGLSEILETRDWTDEILLSHYGI